jgi:hypothetical protein
MANLNLKSDHWNSDDMTPNTENCNVDFLASSTSVLTSLPTEGAPELSAGAAFNLDIVSIVVTFLRFRGGGGGGRRSAPKFGA